ncbi:helix-turn-helix transcriptional regulator [Actinomycetospora straminea]|uniref:HTH araC/xylS-type domain-containing protein n=1 Tax=Actinomycetospora straminea TaxID=663607 RepID=A0ABP9EYR8_9PSEU|nr:helix-turn-helix transcriptional regulator [Actinomycetospora straminea]MDD7935816.1 helix-turn-helix transcriptional regulator [Actinomycetospora straminea]
MTDGESGPEPVLRYRWASTDPEAATEYVRKTYTDLAPVDVPSEDFVFWVEGAAAGPLEISRLRHSGGLRTYSQPTPALVVVETLDGGPNWVDDGTGRVTGPLALLPAWAPYETGWDDLTARVCMVDQTEVVRVGAEVSGLEPEAIAFRGSAPVSPALAAHWSRVAAHVDDDVLASDELMASPLVRADAVRQLAVALLATFPNTALDALTDPGARDGGTAEPGTVRRAAEFMDAHAHRDIGLTEIAEAARIGPRSLQLAFRRHRDTTPLEYLRRVRLENAHRDLQAADPTRGDRVEAIAARWGFGHPGRFSVVYRERYGRSPSATLRH